MKIFEWMHRKVHKNMDYCKMPRKEGADNLDDNGCEMKMTEIEKKALLLELSNVANLHHDLDGTILSIGTLGHYQYHEGFYYMQEEKQQLRQEMLDVNDDPVIIKVSFESPVEIDAKKENKMVMNEKLPMAEEKVAKVALEEENVFEPLLEKKVDGKIERTTLLDLFLESDDYSGKSTIKTFYSKKVSAQAKEATVASKKHHSKVGSTSSYAEKLAAWRKEHGSSHPNKFRRLITKMMRSKIHPAINDVVQTSIVENQAPGQQFCYKTDDSKNDSTSLIWYFSPLITTHTSILGHDHAPLASFPRSELHAFFWWLARYLSRLLAPIFAASYVSSYPSPTCMWREDD